MFIKYTEFVLDPSLRGTSRDIDNVTGRALIAQGAAIENREPRRGSPGWCEWKMEESRRLAGTGDTSGDTSAPYVYPPTWDIRALAITGKPALVYCSGSEVTWFPSLFWFDSKGKKHNAIPSECPASIKKQFEEQLEACSPAASQAQLERTGAQQLDQDAAEKSATSRFFGRLGISLEQKATK